MNQDNLYKDYDIEGELENLRSRYTVLEYKYAHLLGIAYVLLITCCVSAGASLILWIFVPPVTAFQLFTGMLVGFAILFIMLVFIHIFKFRRHPL